MRATSQRSRHDRAEARSDHRVLVRRAAAGRPSRSPRPSELGFDSVWTAEAYGSDCFTPLAWWGARPRRIKLGTAIVQISARTPTATAMAAHHPRPPLGRPVHPRPRRVAARRSSRAGTASRTRSRSPAPASTSRSSAAIARPRGAARLPRRALPAALPRPGTTGLGKPLKSITHPLRADIPIFLGAEGPKNVAHGRRDRRRLAAALLLAEARRALPRRAWPRASPGPAPAAPRTTSRSRAWSPIVVDDDVEGCADFVRHDRSASTSAGWAPRRSTSTPSLFARMGYEDEVREDPGPVPRRPQGRGDRAGAARAGRGRRPGRPARQDPRGARRKWRKTCMTTLLVSGAPDQLRTIADIVTTEARMASGI